MENQNIKETPIEKVLECLHKIEGLFYGYCKIRDKEKYLSMCNTGDSIYFETFASGETIDRSTPLTRSYLETLDDGELTWVIIENIKSIDKIDGGVPYKEHTSFPSRYDIGEKVKVFLMPEGEESFPGFTAIIKAVHFYVGKVKYDVEIKFYGEQSTRIYNLDSILIRDLDFGLSDEGNKVVSL